MYCLKEEFSEFIINYFVNRSKNEEIQYIVK